MNPAETIVPTEFGGIRLSDARALLDIIGNRGFVVFRDLIAERHKSAIHALMSRSLPADAAMFERGVLNVLQTLNTILVVLPKNVATVLEQQEPSPHAEAHRDRSPDEDERSGAGPE